MIKAALATTLLCTVSAATLASTVQFAVNNYDSSDGSAIPLTIGMPFKEGQIPAGDFFTATIKLPTGESSDIPVQVDEKAYHCSDPAFEFTEKDTCPESAKSLRHAVVSLVIPESLSASGQSIVSLVAQPDATQPSGDGSITFPSDLTTEVRLTIDGDLYTASISDVLSNNNLENLTATGTDNSSVSLWLDGPIVKEWILVAPVKNQSNGAIHPNLNARFHVRYFPGSDNAKIDVIVENNWAYAAEAKSFNYDAEILIGGQTRLMESGLEHFIHARWKETFWNQANPETEVIHDPAHLINSNLVPNYDPELIYSLDSTLIDKFSKDWANYGPQLTSHKTTDYSYEEKSYDHRTVYCFKSYEQMSKTSCDDSGAIQISTKTTGPMGIFNLQRYMPATGGRPEIAPLPEWTASYILSQHAAPKFKMMTIADRSGSWPIHFRDQKTGMPISSEDYPAATISSRIEDSLNPDTGDYEKVSDCSPSVSCQTPYVADKAHQPSHAYIPYLISGDYFYLEEMQFWSSYNVLRMTPKSRGYEKGILERSSQIRGAAWALRNLGHVASITPDNHALKSYYTNMIKHNVDTYNAIYVGDQGHPNEFGAANSVLYPVTSPWMDDYLTFSAGTLTELGYNSASEFAAWKGRFPVQRLGYGSDSTSDYCWVLAAPYRLLIAPTDSIPDSLKAVTNTSTFGISTLPYERTFFNSISDVATYSNMATNGGLSMPNGGKLDTSEPCGSAEQAAELGINQGEIIGYSGYESGYAAQMGIALSVAHNQNTLGAIDAWTRYSSRVNQPNFDTAPAWGIVPRALSAQSTIGFPDLDGTSPLGTKPNPPSSFVVQ